MIDVIAIIVASIGAAGTIGAGVFHYYNRTPHQQHQTHRESDIEINITNEPTHNRLHENDVQVEIISHADNEMDVKVNINKERESDEHK